MKKEKFKNYIFASLSVFLAALGSLFLGEAILRLYHACCDKEISSPQIKIQSELNTAQNKSNVLMELNGKNCRWTEMFKSHPYLMYVKKSVGECSEKNINRQGFRGPEYPENKLKKTFTIMVTGGSVAEDQMGLDKITNLEAELNKNYKIAGFDNFKVLVGAMAGWRQPNQMIMMGLYRSILHGYISLDGMNEFELIENPRQRMAGWPTDPFLMTGVEDVLDFKKVFYARCDGYLLKQQLNSKFLIQLYLYYHVTDTIRQYCRKKSQELLKDSDYRQEFTFIDKEISIKEQQKQNGNKFLDYIRNTSSIAKANKIKEIYFIQPTPAYKKILTENEKRVSRDLSYKTLYDKMINDRMSLNKEKIPVVNLANIFENSQEPIFTDYIHLTPAGKLVLQEKIIESLKKLWGLKNKNEN